MAETIPAFELTLSLPEVYPTPSWPNKVADVNAGIEIIKKYIDRDGSVKMIESFTENADGSLEIVMPEWMLDMNRHFTPLYGEVTGELIYHITAIIFNMGEIPDECLPPGGINFYRK